MDLQTRKLELIQEFLKIQSEDVISRLENILKKENKRSGHEDFKPMTIEEFNSGEPHTPLKYRLIFLACTIFLISSVGVADTIQNFIFE